MADALVRELNRLGYQPVFLPRTGVTPPELFNYVRRQRRLVRRGALKEYLPAAADLATTSGQLADIEYRYTSEKGLDASVGFLANALKCIGIDAVPKIDLGFSGTKDFSFAFTGVTYQSVDPAVLDPVLRGMTTTGIPQEYVQTGQLHIAYEYAYAQELLMSRADRKSFREDISGNVGAYLNLGVKGSVSMASSSTISFKGSTDAAAAFAYKAGRLQEEDGQWVFYPEEIARNRMVEERRAYLPQRAVVLTAEVEQ